MAMNKDDKKNDPQQPQQSRTPKPEDALPRSVGGTPFPGPGDGNQIGLGDEEGKVGGGE